MALVVHVLSNRNDSIKNNEVGEQKHCDQLEGVDHPQLQIQTGHYLTVLLLVLPAVPDIGLLHLLVLVVQNVELDYLSGLLATLLNVVADIEIQQGYPD